MKQRVTFDVFYPHSPERVWRALTDPSALQRWLMPTDFRPRLGHRFRFRQEPDAVGQGDGVEGVGERERRQLPRQPIETVSCEVVALEEPHRLAYTWQSDRDPEPTLVTWTLEPVEGGTRLQLEHSAMSATESLVFHAEASANWTRALTAGLPVTLAQPDRPASPRSFGRILLPRERQTVLYVGRQRLRAELQRL